MNLKILQGKIEALVSAGMPGIYRVVMFFLIQKIYSIDELGSAASDLSIAQIFSFFTAIGWALLIMVRVPSAANKEDALVAFYRLCVMAFLTTIAVLFGVFVFVKIWDLDLNFAGFSSALIGWSLYQLARHYFVAKKNYSITIFYDVFLLVVSISFLILSKWFEIGSIAALSGGLIVVSVLMFWHIGIPVVKTIGFDYEIKGLEFGLTNFLTGGIVLSLVPLAKYLNGESFSGAISLILSLAAIGFLVPRAISLYRLPDLAKLVDNKQSMRSKFHQMKKEIALSNIITSIINVIMIIVVAYWIVEKDARQHLLLVGLLLVAQSTAAMSGLVYSNVLIAFEKGRVSVKINIGTSLLLFMLTVLLIFYGGSLAFLSVAASSLLVTIIRNYFLRSSSLVLMRE